MALREYKKLLKKTRKEQELRKESGEKVQQTKPTLRTAEGRNDSDTISCSRSQVCVSLSPLVFLSIINSSFHEQLRLYVLMWNIKIN